MFTDDDLNVREAASKVDLDMQARLDALIKESLADGQEDWQVGEWCVIAAFRVLEDIDDIRLRLLYAQHLARLANHMTRKMLEQAVARRLAEEAAASAPGKDPTSENR